MQKFKTILAISLLILFCSEMVFADGVNRPKKKVRYKPVKMVSKKKRQIKFELIKPKSQKHLVVVKEQNEHNADQANFGVVVINTFCDDKKAYLFFIFNDSSLDFTAYQRSFTKATLKMGKSEFEALPTLDRLAYALANYLTANFELKEVIIEENRLSFFKTAKFDHQKIGTIVSQAMPQYEVLHVKSDNCASRDELIANKK